MQKVCCTSIDILGGKRYNTYEYSVGIANINPFRYRGYYYDEETGFYYLNSRYYDPVTGRFINMDDVSVVTASPTALTDKNLFAYCDNNPVMRTDNGGEFWIPALIGAIAGAVIRFASAVVSELAEQAIDANDTFDWGDVAIATGIGALEGGTTALCPTAAPIISAGAGATEALIDGLRDADRMDFVIKNSLLPGLVGFSSGSSIFSKGSRLIDDAAKLLGTAFRKGVHPAVKKSAAKTVDIHLL